MQIIRTYVVLESVSWGGKKLASLADTDVRAFALPRRNTLYIHTAPTSEAAQDSKFRAEKNPVRSALLKPISKS